MLRKIATTAGPFCLGATAITVSDASKKASQGKEESPKHYQCKPTDLPLYTPLHAANKKAEPQEHISETSVRHNIESGISVVRKEVFGVWKAVASQKKVLDDTFATGREHSKVVIEYLNEPGNAIPRVGAVAIGGLAGFIFALRGGFIRRVLFTGIGAGGVASICYPKDAEICAQQAIVQAKKGTNIVYNFVYGIKPGDDVNQPTWPKIPSNFSELSESMSDLAKSAKDALFSSKK